MTHTFGSPDRSLAMGSASAHSARLTPGLVSILKVFLTIALAVLVLLPLWYLISTSLTDSTNLQGASFTFRNFADATLDPALVRVVSNTLIFAIGSTTLGITIAFCLAWLTERTDMPGSTVVRVVLFAWMAVPPLVFGYGWLLALNPNNGFVTNILNSLLGDWAPPISPYRMTSLIFIAGLGLVPTSFVMLSALLQKMDPSLEDAGLMSGASRFTVFRRITAPLLTPGLLSVAVFLFMAMIQTLDLPLIIGVTAQLPMLSTRTYLIAFPELGVPNLGLAAAYGVLLLVFAIGLMLLYFCLTHSAERFRVISGKGFRPRRTALSLPKKIAAVSVVCAYFVIMLIPLGLLAWGSLLPFFQVPSWSALELVSLNHYTALFRDAFVRRALTNTVILMIVSATIAMLLSFLIAWLAVRHTSWLTKVLDTASFSVIAAAPDGSREDLAGLRWSLKKIERNYQWYRTDSGWNYEPVTYTSEVANGTVDAGLRDAGRITFPVQWGRYRLEVETADPMGPATSVEFEAGWFVEAASTEYFRIAWRSSSRSSKKSLLNRNSKLSEA